MIWLLPFESLILIRIDHKLCQIMLACLVINIVAVFFLISHLESALFKINKELHCFYNADDSL